MNAKNNAGGDWNPKPAAQECGAIVSQNDFGFAWEALGFRDELAGMTPARLAAISAGTLLSMAGIAGLLLLGA